MRNAIQLLHEYLADEGTINSGIDTLKYQALLVNQMAEAKLINLSSNFNHSLIIKRITMINNQNNSPSTFKTLVFLPMAIFLFFGIALFNAQAQTSNGNESSSKVLYIGLNNAVTIATPTSPCKGELIASIDNGNISVSNDSFIVNPIKAGKATITQSCNGEIKKKTVFLVKHLPQLTATIGGVSKRRNLFEAIDGTR